MCFILRGIEAAEERQENLILSTPDQVASLSQSEYLIGGVISPFSGQVLLRQTDLIAKGAQEVVLSRIHTPLYMPCSFPKQEEQGKHHKKHHDEQDEHDKRYLYNYLMENYKGWQFFPHHKLQFFPQSKIIRLSDPSGMTLDFHVPDSAKSPAPLASPSFGCNNTAGDIPDAKNDLRNTRIAYEGNRITVYAADGAIRFYIKQARASWLSYFYLLEKEILPHGKILKYRYGGSYPVHIESLDPQERYSYASISISGSPWQDGYHFTSSSGTVADYRYQKRPIQWEIKEKHKLVQRANKDCPPLLSSVSSPFYRQESLQYCSRFLLGVYSGKDMSFTLINDGYDDKERHYRVRKLFFPVGPNDAFDCVYELDYQPAIAGNREGSTTVKMSDGTSVVYHFSKNLLTTCIQYFGQDKALKKEKHYDWDERNWLKSIAIKDTSQKSLYKKSYEYDAYGNPILETFIGDLTGEGAQETFTTKRTFSQEGRHLLLQEETEDGKVICFSYLPHTNLIASKLIKQGEKILLRSFFVYDDCNNLIQTISDDGISEDKNDLSSVTQRTSTAYALRQSAPFLHMPEWAIDAYWENGLEKPLKKRHFIYDSDGNIAQEEIYDANGEWRYTLSKIYNERGDILSETNPLGQTAFYTYDAKGRCLTSTNFSDRLYTTCVYDTQGRLRKQTENGNDGIVHTLSCDYDAQDRLISKLDTFENRTSFTYDPLVNEVTQTDFPPIASLDGHSVPVTTHSTYDALGRETSKTDANGNITTYRYNAYGSPIEIVHPHGAIETFRYAKNGQRIRYTDTDGLTTLYTNDILGRVLVKTTLSLEGIVLAEESYTYNGFNLLAATDKEGNVKKTFYDGAGRKIREEFCDKITDFTYDALGYLSCICKHNGLSTLFIHYERDLEGRILQERKTDASDHTLYRIDYSYDADGNRSAITRHINGKESIHSYLYDSFNRLIEETDAQGSATKTSYDENYINNLNQQVLNIKTTDPLGISTLQTKDALNRTVNKQTLNPRGRTIACQEMTHDPQGNLLFQRDHVYENDRYHKTETIAYTYTPEHRIESLTRAFDTIDARTTTYRYLPSGKMAAKTLPSQITLAYHYDPLGNMSRLTSSDGAIDHLFEYDRLGHLIFASDENHNIQIHRRVDPFGNVLHEVLPLNLEVHKKYDAFHRLISLKMGNHGEVLYDYDPLFLRKVSRLTPRGKTFYSHTYDAYDEDGNLICENLIGNLGQVMHSTDQRGQKFSLSSPYFSQEYRYDPVGNLTQCQTDGKQQYYAYDDLSQLSSEKNLHYAYDSLNNRTRKNDTYYEIDDLNELLSFASHRCAYDLDGNQILKQTPTETWRFTYDPLNRLIEAASEEKKIHFLYDPLGRRVSKTVHTFLPHGWKEMHEHYLYHGQNEIGAFGPHNEPKNLRVLGLSLHKNNPATISIEIDNHVFAPLLDAQGNIRRLIDTQTRTLAYSDDFTAFGEESQASPAHVVNPNPWRFASKRLDPELGLIYFGKRYYDPQFGRWLTIDPAGFIDSVNLYQYVLNNPFRYVDPDGRLVFAIPLVALTWKVLALAVATAVVKYEVDKLMQNRGYSASARDFNDATHEMVRGVAGGIGGVAQYILSQSLSMEKKRQVDVRLPSNPDELLDDPNWEEISHPEAKAKGHRIFENKTTGETLRHDEAKPGKDGHRGESHWHRDNPNSTNKFDEYLDAQGNPVPDGHSDSHLYPPADWV